MAEWQKTAICNTGNTQMRKEDSTHPVVEEIKGMNGAIKLTRSLIVGLFNREAIQIISTTKGRIGAFQSGIAL